MEQKSVDNALLLPTMYLRQAGLTRNPTFSYLYCVRCRGQGAASKAPLERKYSRWAPGRGRVSVDGTRQTNQRLTSQTWCRQADGDAQSKRHQNDKYFPRRERGHFIPFLHRDILYWAT
jgi:hypothetical protein